ncbi:orotate phosphoribosyltransferase [Bacillus daqingensis]|uniref:Orotate phosphoribosyltransferase n=1 Tax=Bacillus daqingensis TaxID=872396 RepID=A0ABV9NT85_9BACI
MNQYKAAELLLDIEAVVLSPEHPFTWSSGLQSPIYCDNRLLMSYPDARKQVAEWFSAKARELGADIIAGTATAGIPHAAWAADLAGLPMIYVRSSPKSHGRKNKIEGNLPQGAKVLIVEDLLSTGGSAFKAAEAVEEEGGIPVGIAAIFTYELHILQRQIEKRSFPVEALTSFPILLDTAKSRKVISGQEADQLANWNTDPAGWSDAFTRS